MVPLPSGGRRSTTRRFTTPKPAANAGEVANALENWDTSQRLHRQCGGLPLREVELRSIILRILPHDIKMHIIQVSQSILTYEHLKNYVKEHARTIAVHMTKSTPAHLAETEDFGESITDEFLERTENLTASDQLLELGFAPGTEAYAALATKLAARKNVWRAGKGRKFEKGGTKGGGKGKVDSGGGKGAGKGGFAAPKSKDGRPICVNCNEIGHDQTSCTKPRVEAKDRLCLKCDKKGHTARQCKSGLPLKEIGAEEGEDQYTLSLEGDMTMNCSHSTPGISCGGDQVEEWKAVKDGSRYPHKRLGTSRFEHQTSFQVFDDESEDEIYSDEGEVDNEDGAEVVEAWYRDHPCCGMGCQARGLPCTTAMIMEMRRPWLPEDPLPIPPPVCCEPTALPEDPVPAPPLVCGSTSSHVC